MIFFNNNTNRQLPYNYKLKQKNERIKKKKELKNLWKNDQVLGNQLKNTNFRSNKKQPM